MEIPYRHLPQLNKLKAHLETGSLCEDPESNVNFNIFKSLLLMQRKEAERNKRAILEDDTIDNSIQEPSITQV